MHAYDTVTEALNDLRNRGFVLDFNLEENAVICQGENLRLQPSEFHIREVYRFEGNSNPSDEEVVYAIESNDGQKGVLVSAFGTYAEDISDEMIIKLKRD